jgi:uncharacterized protein (TIGR02001 family)
MFKKTLIASALLAGSSAAVAEISGNVTLASDYVFRGVSQTDNQIAIQGGFDYEHASGLYAGTWASNVDSNFLGNDGVDPQIELDVYVGYGMELANGIGLDFGVLQYIYPGSDSIPAPASSSADTTEFYVGGSMGGFSVQLNYSDELSFIWSNESAWYLSAGYEMELPQDFGLALHLGHSFGDAYDVGPGSSSAGLPDSYTDWSIGVSKNMAGVDLGLTYTGSDGDDSNMFGDLADDRIVVSISKSL